MNPKRIFLTVLQLCFAWMAAFSQTGPGAFLPDKDEITGWRPAGEMNIWNRTSLGNLVPGERELILEYGFNYAVSRRYYNFRNEIIEIRAFVMNNTFGSYGLFLRNSRNLEVFREFGNSAYRKDGEYGFWKQYYFVRMQSQNSNDTITDGYRQFAAFIDSRIRSNGILPGILRFSENSKGNILLIRGPLALSEVYYFSPLNIFFIEEGMAIENEDSMEIILKYSDKDVAVHRYTDAANILSSMTKFSDFVMAGELSFVMKDRDGRTLVFKIIDDCLHISIK